MFHCQMIVWYWLSIHQALCDLDYSTDRSSSPESDEMKWNHNVAKKRQISQPYKFGEHITIWIENISLQQDFQMQNMVM